MRTRLPLALTWVLALGSVACNTSPAPTTVAAAPKAKVTTKPAATAAPVATDPPADVTPTPQASANSSPAIGPHPSPSASTDPGASLGASPKVSPSASSSPGVTPTAAPAATPTATPTASPSATPTATPTATPSVGATLPPLVFPFTRVGLALDYQLSLSAQVFGVTQLLGGTASAKVIGVQALSSAMEDGTAITQVPASLNGQLVPDAVPKISSTNVAASVTNPYTPSVLFPASGAPAVVDTLTAVSHEDVTVPLGTYHALKYLVSEQVGASDHNDITLWIDQASQVMVKEVVVGNKLPPLGAVLGPIAPFASGPVTTTFVLTNKL